MAIVYQATNLVNGKRYIGVTRRSLAVRRSCHHYEAKASNRTLCKALRKYGKDKFEWKVLHDYLYPEDAITAEVRFVAHLRPEYNMTAGGDGITGFIMPASAKAKISAAHTAERKERGAIAMSNRMSGRKMPWVAERNKGQENRDRARHFGKIYAKEFVARQRGKPKGNERMVLCVTDGMEFPSASAAARQYTVSKSAIIEHCNGVDNRLTVRGKVFQYKDAPVTHRASKKCKLCWADVGEIKMLLGVVSQGRIAQLYGVNRVTITDIAVGRTWKEKPDDVAA